MSNLTPTQARYLSFIKSYMGGFQVAPAESEIAEALKVSPPSVNRMMRTPGFYNYLEAMSDPSHPEHEDYLENYGPFDPSKFDHQKTTTRMRQRLRMR